MGYELFDMHCHLGFYANPVEAARELASAGIAVLNATVTPAEFERVGAELAAEPNVRCGVGLHPWWVADGRMGAADVSHAAQLAADSRFVAEVGLDFAHGRDASAARQTDALGRLLERCAGGGHVLSVHAVRSAGAVLDLLDAQGTLLSRAPRGRNAVIFHWFSGTSEELHRAVSAGCYFSVGPRMLTTRRGREYARQIPVTRLLLETDLPSSLEDGRTLSPLEAVTQLRSAADALASIRGPEALRTIAATSRELFGL